METTERQIAEFLGAYSAEIQSFAQDLRAYLKDETQPAFELAGKSAQSFNIGYGFTTTAWDCFCAIIVYRNHINLSFPSGASLPDPDKLLHGTGSRVRHLKIKELADLQTPAAKKLLAEARKQALFLARDARTNHQGVKTVFKERKG